MNRKKLKPIVEATWTYEEWNNLSKLRQLYVRIARVLYSQSWKKLFTTEFWEELNADKYSCIGEWFFFFRYKLFWIVEVDKNGEIYCL